MTYSVNPSIVTSGLVLHHDAANARCYNGGENLISYSNYNVATWSLPIGGGTLTTGIDAPDGTLTAVRLTSDNVNNTLLRVTHPNITPSGTDPYTISFYVRLVTGSAAASSLTSDWTDGGPSVDYRSQLVNGQWVRITATSIAAANLRAWLDIVNNTINNYTLDFWGVQIEKGSVATTLTPTSGSTVTRGTTILSLSGTNTGTMVGNVAYTSTNGGAWTFTGNTTSNAYYSVPAGHADYTQGITIQVAGSMDLSGGTWMRFIDFGNGPGSNNIIMYRNSGDTRLGVDVYGTTYINVQSPIGSLTNNENVIWCFTYDGTRLQLYKNGSLGNTAIGTLTIPNVTRNNCFIGRSNWSGDPALRGNVYDVKIYNRALTATEVAKNAAALRGRFNV